MSKIMRVPEGWEVKKVSQISKTFAGGTPNRENFTYYNGNIPWVKSGEVNQSSILKTEETITQDGLNNSNAKFVPKGTILVAMYGATAGKIALLNIDATTNQAVLAIPLKNDNIFFIRYMLEFHMPKLVFQAQGSGQPNLSKQMVDNMLLLLPSKKEQEKIAKILSTLDKAIESSNRLIAKEKNIKTALMQELLTNGIDQNGQIRSPKTYTYKQSELGLIPEEWEVDKLNEVTKLMTDFVANGSFASLADNVTVFNSPEFAYYVRLVDIRKGLGHEKQTYVDEQSFKFLKKSSLTGKEILIANIGANVGETFLMPILNKPSTIAPNMIVINVNNKIIPEFLFYFLTYHKGISELQNVTEGSGQPKINKTKLKTVNVLIPKIQEQKQIAKILSIQDKKIQTEETNLAKQKELKKGLMNDLLSGKVRVKI